MGSVVRGAFTGSGYRVPQGTDPELKHYLEERDYGPGSGSIGLLPRIDMPSTAGSVLCEVQWNYEQKAPPRGVKIDGFVIWLGFKVGAGVVPEPTVQGAKLSEDARSYAFPVPPGIAMRIGIQTYRNVHQGEFRSEKLFPLDWICDNRETCTAVRFHLPLRPLPDGVTREFFPIDPSIVAETEIVIATRTGNIWQATLNYRRGPWPYQPRAEAPFEPDVGYWTGNDANRVRFNENDIPQTGDFLEFEVATVC